MPASYLSPKLEVRAAPHKGGFAVFAREALQKDELICVWTGRAVTFEQLRRLSPLERSHTLQVDDQVYLAPLGLEEEPADFINHSCQPNAGIRGQISLVAMRPIAAGEKSPSTMLWPTAPLTTNSIALAAARSAADG
jgi:hypothetical protein